MIELKNLSTGYGTKVVASGLNATLREGELISLLGSNGVGKSTLLRTMSAFQPSLEGDIIIQGKKLDSLKAQELSKLIGVVLTERPTLHNMTARDLVGMGRSPYTGFWGKLAEEDEAIIDQAIRMVGITSLQQRQVSTLSDGERQKVMIAKALAQQTPVILLDEPTAFLDFPSKVEMLRLLRKLAHKMGKIVFLSTHDVELAIQLSDRLWIMHPGKLVTGTPEQLSHNGELANFILVEGITYDPVLKSYRIANN